MLKYEFEFWQDLTTDYEIICPWASEKSLINAYALINAHPPIWTLKMTIFSSPVQSTGRAIVLTLASVFPLALPLPFLSRHF